MGDKMLLLFIKAAFIFLTLIVFILITNPEIIKKKLNISNKTIQVKKESKVKEL